MNPIPRLAGVHLGFAALLFPLIMLWFVDGIEASTESGYGSLAYIAAAIVYFFVAVTNKPDVIYHGASKLGISRKTFRVLLISAFLLLASIPVGELGGAGYLIAMMALVVALALFLWAAFIALFVHPTT
jgi:hypothetical protein